MAVEVTKTLDEWDDVLMLNDMQGGEKAFLPQDTEIALIAMLDKTEGEGGDTLTFSMEDEEYGAMRQAMGETQTL